jgi:hypothetical protein
MTPTKATPTGYSPNYSHPFNHLKGDYYHGTDTS